jgi:phytanoyl-CoA hydroxylase
MGQVSSERARDDAFGEDGFVHMSGFFSPRQIAEVLANIDRYIREVVPAAPATDVFYEDKARPETLKQLIRLHARDAFFRRLLEEGSLRETAARLLGEAVRPINQQVFIKPPGGDSRPTPPHQDGFYFHLEPCIAATLWLALDDVDAENGCLRYVRGSHRRGVRPHQRTTTLGFSQGVSDFGTPEDVANEVACTARAGDLVAHHAMTIHRADANRAPDRPRRALGLIYYGVSARESGAEHAAYQRRLAAEMKQAGRI